uniref:Reverse transcriptase Ty1/copia-type domain-containing protein n=1 Tax=Solanum lycopersicum TaxID=4081 RepID=A0A3Q7IDS2_SOLLC
MTVESTQPSSISVTIAAKIRPIHDPSSVYYLHPSEGPSNSLTKYLLKGDNFDVWEQAICNALEGRSKIGVLYEKGFPKPTNELELDAWKANNSIISSWIFNRADETIQPSIVAHKITHELWTDITAKYGGTNSPRSWQLKSDLQMLRQRGQYVVSYYNQFITIWNQLYGSIDPTCGCICPVAARMRQEKTHAFLLGLDDAQFGATRSQIFGTRPLPVLNEAYYLVSQEERHKSIVRNRDDHTDGLAFAVETQSTPPLKYKCTHCRKNGHSAEWCFLLIGFPSGGRRGRRGGRGGRRGRGPPSGREQSAGRGDGMAAHADSPTSLAVTTGSSQGGNFPGLSAEQMTRLLNMLDTPTQSGNNTGTVHALSPDWLSDSGASHHMTGNFSSLYDIMSVPECSIDLPDGTHVVANYCGSDRVLTTEIGRGTARNGVYVFQSQAFVSASRVDQTNIAPQQPEFITSTKPTTTVPPVDLGVVPPPSRTSSRVRHPPGYLSEYVCQSATHVPPVTRPSTTPRSAHKDHTLFIFRRGADFLAILIYIDDILVTGNNLNLCASFKKYLHNCFQLKDLGPLKYFLGIECARSSTVLVLCQCKYALEILQEAGLTDCKSASTPLLPGHGLATSTSATIRDPSKYRRLVGRLIYLMITRLDLAYLVHLLSQFMHEPRVDHLNVAMHVLRYLKGHPGQGILLRADSNLQIMAYCDLD